ncbi:Class III cytochrome C family protein [Maridesulfovibrio ferrireducens]|uniref:Class III cytochrome C family protein n=1 Tax=Maridesulfovibrio ferrireducens TaxID=246191 RepID=A0A1G9K8G2_9BACT|nr:cytochrome c3 family protein [Maridesulfovibrio ferrireducens]SDL45816.1 Class III cytochrome C family protein [Maridesulfovibrio ferrireducens]
MANGKKLLRLSSILIVLAGVLGFHLEAMSMVGTPQGEGKQRPDLIMIDAIAAQQKLELPAVVFLHDAHTKAAAEQGKDCTACHQKNKDVTSLKFMRVEDGTPEKLKEIYHNGCISCHAKDAAAGKKTGPQVGECRSCHQADPEYKAERATASMDKTLHFRHWDSKIIENDKGQETNCGSCHHEYDKATQKLVYVKGQEENCGICHTAKPEGDVKKDTSEAFHSQCVTCHLDLAAAKAKKFGPVQCAGCHGLAEAADIKADDAQLLKKMGGILPRLPRKQPDAVLLTAPAPKDSTAKTEVKGKMSPVAFNHKAHENVTESCGSCHHQTLKKSCSECHTDQGSKDGGFITLDQAMHNPDSPQSCVGCHAIKQKDPNCAGCHELMPKKVIQSETTCVVCHEAPKDDTNPAALDASAKAELAKDLIIERPTSPAMLETADIPEFVTINALENEYKESKLPHRKIIFTLVENMKSNSLANTFHSTPLTVCASCHHNSPASKTPPSCASCHANAAAKEQGGRPALKAAYHGQCMTCHESMELKKPASTDCSSCHEPKKNG